MFRSILMIAIVGMLSACISGVPKTESYTDSSGKTTLIQSNAEMCTSSCNGDYDRCMETMPAQTTPGIPQGMGASGDCRSSLKECLRGCKSQ